MREYIPKSGLTKYRIRELYAFCRQYEQKPSDKRKKIEAAALVAADGNEIIYEALMRNVTQGIAFSALDVPCSKNTFSKTRQKFFLLLDKVV